MDKLLSCLTGKCWCKKYQKDESKLNIVYELYRVLAVIVSSSFFYFQLCGIETLIAEHNFSYSLVAGGCYCL